MLYRSLICFLMLSSGILFGMDVEMAVPPACGTAAALGTTQPQIYSFAQEWETLENLRQLFPEEAIHWLTEEEEWESSGMKPSIAYCRDIEKANLSTEQKTYLTDNTKNGLQTIDFLPQTFNDHTYTLMERNKVRPTRVEYRAIPVPHSRYVIVIQKTFCDEFAKGGIFVQMSFASNPHANSESSTPRNQE